ncbi:MAG TPA: hypothetical protein VMZ28_19315 [Kofleriaceae bacterium]|nr:hypothetical protein [Kofleriaceae bacterium]
MACDAQATAKAQMLLDAAYQCGGNFCLGMSGVAARCKLDANDELTNLDGTPAFGANGPSGDCATCLLNSTAKLDGFSCEPLNDPACNPAACAPSANACTADKP